MLQVILHDLVADGLTRTPRADLKLDHFPSIVGRDADCDGLMWTLSRGMSYCCVPMAYLTCSQTSKSSPS
jgi:hypothetical protein